MDICHSIIEDLNDISRPEFMSVIEFQKTAFHKSGLPFDRKLTAKEIAEERHWKTILTLNESQRLKC